MTPHSQIHRAGFAMNHVTPMGPALRVTLRMAWTSAMAIDYWPWIPNWLLTSSLSAAAIPLRRWSYIQSTSVNMRLVVEQSPLMIWSARYRSTCILGSPMLTSADQRIRDVIYARNCCIRGTRYSSALTARAATR
eukprot:scaffold249_cov405-Prasinococcus_capsulatus_cf.AAC.7